MTPLAGPGSRGILIGTGHHPPGATLRDVPAVGPSLTDLANILREQAGVPGANITLALDPAGPAELAEQLDTIAAAATDVLLVYVVGHGLVGDGAELYLATAATTDPVQGLAYRALPYRTLLTILRASPRPHHRHRARLLLRWPRRRARRPRQFDAILERAPLQGGVVLTAAARDEYALAPPGERYTNFTGALIRLLREGDPAGPRDLTIEHVYRHLSSSLRNSARTCAAPTPQQPWSSRPIPPTRRRSAGGRAGRQLMSPARSAGCGRSARRTPASSLAAATW
jgi:hypothetical protein